MAWTPAELTEALVRFEQELSDARLQGITIQTYVDYAKRFLRWREGAYRPRSAKGPKREPATEAADVKALQGDLADYRVELEAAGLAPRAVATYVDAAARFVRWLGGTFTPGSRDSRVRDNEPAPREWIFQSTPDRYDLTSALAELPEVTWLVNQYPNQIHAGDRVFLWETGEASGVVALATVITEPAPIDDSRAERRFWRKPEDFEGARRRVRLQIDEVLKPRLLRSRIVKEPRLSGLRNVRFANATNFPVSEEQGEALMRLIHDVVEPRDSEKARQHFIAVLAAEFPETWARCKELGQWGSTQLDRIAKAVQPGDRLLIWLGRTGFKAIAEFTSSVYEVTPTPENEWSHGSRTYPFRFDIRVIAEFESIYRPSFPGGRNQELGMSTAQLQRSLVQITPEQYELIVGHLDQRNATTGKRPGHVWHRLAASTISSFGSEWEHLIELLKDRPEWSTLIQGVAVHAENLTPAAIRYTTSRAAARSLTRQQVERAWTDVLTYGVHGVGYLKTAEKAPIPCSSRQL